MIQKTLRTRLSESDHRGDGPFQLDFDTSVCFVDGHVRDQAADDLQRCRTDRGISQRLRQFLDLFAVEFA